MTLEITSGQTYRGKLLEGMHLPAPLPPLSVYGSIAHSTACEAKRKLTTTTKLRTT